LAELRDKLLEGYRAMNVPDLQETAKLKNVKAARRKMAMVNALVYAECQGLSYIASDC